MFKFCLLLFVATISLLPNSSNAECCHKKLVRYRIPDENSNCRDFGGSLADFNLEDVYNYRVHLYPNIDFCLNKTDKRICEVDVCEDGKPSKGTYCGKGSCNIFGCNCDGGCIKGNALLNFLAIHGDKVRSV